MLKDMPRKCVMEQTPLGIAGFLVASGRVQSGMADMKSIWLLFITVLSTACDFYPFLADIRSSSGVPSRIR